MEVILQGVYFLVTLAAIAQDGQSPPLKRIEKVRFWFFSSMEFSPDGKMLASAGKVSIFDVASKRRIFHVGREDDGGGFSSSVAFSPDGETIAAHVAGAVRLYDIASGAKVMELKTDRGSESFRHIVWSPDGKILASDAGAALYLWDVSAKQRIAEFDKVDFHVGPVSFSPDSTTVAVAGHDGNIRLFIIPQKRQVSCFENPHPQAANLAARSLSFSRDGKKIASSERLSYGYHLKSGGNSLVRVLNADNGGQLFCLEGHAFCAFSPDGKRLASSNGTKHTVHVWDSETGRELLKFAGHDGVVRTIAWSPTGELLASAGSDGFIFLWDTRKAK
jgi:WD40 repeat protein